MERFLGTLPANIQAEVYSKRALAADHWNSIGVFTDEQKQSYSGYDRKTLQELGNQGDLLALDILADKYLREDRDLVKNTETNLKAVLFGSAKAALSLGTIPTSKSFDAEGRSNLINAITWHQISAKMGHKLAESFRDSGLKVRGLTLTEEEWMIVEQKTDALYAQLNKKRRELGLPEYSN